jgi:hypothetical protein
MYKSQADALNSFFGVSLLNNTLFQFHIEVCVKFFIETPYFYNFILLSNCHDFLTFPNWTHVNRISLLLKIT